MADIGNVTDNVADNDTDNDTAKLSKTCEKVNGTAFGTVSKGMKRRGSYEKESN